MISICAIIYLWSTSIYINIILQIYIFKKYVYHVYIYISTSYTLENVPFFMYKYISLDRCIYVYFSRCCLRKSSTSNVAALISAKYHPLYKRPSKYII